MILRIFRSGAGVAFFALAFLLPPALRASTVTTVQTSVSQGETSQPVEAYPDSAQGLRALLTQVMKLVRKDDTRALAPYLASMELPDPDHWFRAVYGDKIGGRLGKNYLSLWPALRAGVFVNLHDFLGKGMKNLAIEGRPADCQFPLPAAWFDPSKVSAEPTTYFVGFNSEKLAGALGNFVYEGGAFRYLGLNTDLLDGIGVTGPKLVRSVLPKYPKTELKSNIGGTIFLRGVIGTDGSVHGLTQVNNGFFASKVKAAVRQWRYKPGRLEGTPVAIRACFVVIFSPRGP